MIGRRLLTIDRNSNPVPAPPSGELQGKDASKGGLNSGFIITICVIAFVATKIFLGILIYWRWSKRHRICEVKVSGGKMVMFRSSGKATPSSKVILKKTQNLSNNDIIGSGGYGVVYRLVVDENTAFAVKKLARGNPDQQRGFERELETLSDIKHRNIVSLRGYYMAPHVNLLIYDLMLNGSLEMVLHDRLIDQPLDWPIRYNIALGTARGIAYLHHDCIPHIIHRDIKSSNILLDENLEAHVSDFGLAKLLELNKSHATTIVAGTLGYLAPEYLETGKATMQGDVYSYGVVLLELVTGNRPTDRLFVEKSINLASWVRDLVESGQVVDAFDDELRDSCPEEDLKEAIDIAYQCVDPDPQHRPTMPQVVKMLERITVDVDDSFEGIPI